MKKLFLIVLLSIVVWWVTYSFDIEKVYEITSNTLWYTIVEINEVPAFKSLSLNTSEERFLQLKWNLWRTVSVWMYQLDSNHWISDIDEILENVTMKSSHSLYPEIMRYYDSPKLDCTFESLHEYAEWDTWWVCGHIIDSILLLYYFEMPDWVRYGDLPKSWSYYAMWDFVAQFIVPLYDELLPTFLWRDNYIELLHKKWTFIDYNNVESCERIWYNISIENILWVNAHYDLVSSEGIITWFLPWSPLKNSLKNEIYELPITLKSVDWSSIFWRQDLINKMYDNESVEIEVVIDWKSKFFDVRTLRAITYSDTWICPEKLRVKELEGIESTVQSFLKKKLEWLTYRHLEKIDKTIPYYISKNDLFTVTTLIELERQLYNLIYPKYQDITTYW